MKVIKYLYYKIYCWQVWVKNSDPICGAALSLTMSFLLYIVSLSILANIVLGIDWDMRYLICFLLIGPIVCLYLKNKRHAYKILVEMHRRYKKRLNGPAILFVIGSYFFIIVAGILGMVFNCNTWPWLHNILWKIREFGTIL